MLCQKNCVLKNFVKFTQKHLYRSLKKLLASRLLVKKQALAQQHSEFAFAVRKCWGFCRDIFMFFSICLGKIKNKNAESTEFLGLIKNTLPKIVFHMIFKLYCISAANKGQSMVNYHQSLAFDHPYIYHVMIIVTSGFLKKSFFIIIICRSSHSQLFFKAGIRKLEILQYSQENSCVGVSF